MPSHFEGILDGIRVFLAVSGEFSSLHTLWVPPGKELQLGPKQPTGADLGLAVGNLQQVMVCLLCNACVFQKSLESLS